MKKHTPNPVPNTPVAIVGIGCFFPRASGLKGYWRLLLHGTDAITDVPDSHWSIDDYFDADPSAADKIYCTRGGFLSPVDFDPTEFGIPPNNLEATDTSQLLGLIAAKTALEDAGYGDTGRTFNRDRASVILGVTGTQELVIPLGARLDHPKWRRALKSAGIADDKAEEVVQHLSAAYVPWQENSFPGLLGNVVAGRISNRLNLGGTNCVVDAACASSMGAMHLAVLELTTLRSDMVLTGGVDTLNDIFMHMCFGKTRILSPTGDIRPFSARADGTVLGEGVGIVALKRLADAEKDNDRIYAVIRGVGSSSDGRSQSIYAPRKDGQVKAMRMAYQLADINPDTVDLVEAHGTGTRVGDQTEFQSLSEIFPADGQHRNGKNRCALGAVKSMIGHTKAAAGTAGLIKAALALHHKTLPPTLKADDPDPDLHIEDSAFYLNTAVRPWLSRSGHPRRSGVSAFGFGGSNFHMVLEEYQKKKKEIAWDGQIEIVALSTDTARDLSAAISDWVARIDSNLAVEAFASAAARSRIDFNPSAPYRFLFYIDRAAADQKRLKTDLAGMQADLADIESDRFIRTTGSVFFGAGDAPGRLAFVFPGQGSQYVGMGRDLACIFPDALDAFETFNAFFEKDRRLSDFIFPCPAAGKKEQQVQEEALRPTDIAQPAIGAMSLALFRILSYFGISPTATCGHSYGELVALRAAGWLDTDALCRTSIARGRLMADAGTRTEGDPGTMMAVKAPLSDLDTLVADLDSDVILANRNSPRQGVLSGSRPAITAAEKKCKALKFRAIPLPVAAAFHSPLVAAARKPFRRLLTDIDLTPTDTPVFSNTTGQPYPASPDAARDILGNQITRPVDFVSNVENLYAAGVQTFVEVGPKTVLTGLIRQILRKHPHTALAIDASGGKKFGLIDLAAGLCHLAALGYPVRLDRWESPPPETPRSPRMRFPIGGANYKPASRGPSRTAPSTKQPDTPPENVAAENKTPAHLALMDTVMTESPTPTHAIFPARPARRSTTDPVLSDTAEIIREGLRSMREIQASTAAAHELFLKTQAEASRTLQALMTRTRGVAREAGLLAPSAAEDTPPMTAPAPTVTPVSLQPAATATPPYPDPRPETTAATAPAPVHDMQDDQPGLTPAQTRPSDDIIAALFEVIAELTGYPADMLTLEMDIESDLGIDSIKRVEILSAMEDRMPDLPAIAPEDMGEIKTLGQIVSHLNTDAAGTEPDPIADRPADPGMPPEAAPAASCAADAVAATLKDVVSELTGYPADMLTLEMDIESDLGIDSIKRVEILSAMEDRMPDLPAIAPEDMGEIKTLGQIVRFLTTGSENAAKPDRPKPPEAATSTTDSAVPALTRRVIAPQTAAFSVSSTAAIAPPHPILITEDGSGLAPALAAAFGKQNISATLIPAGAAALKQIKGPISGLILVFPDASSSGGDIRMAFRLARAAGKGLLSGDGDSPRFFSAVTRMDGAFGFLGAGGANPLQGALAGLVKTAAAEWADVRCRAIDVAPAWRDPAVIARSIVTALTDTSPQIPVEIGLHPDLPANTYYRLDLSETEWPVLPPGLSGEDVVVVSGGARGITAAAVIALARRTGARFALLGRSPQPSPLPRWLPENTDPATVKRAILAHDPPAGKNGQPPSPTAVELAFKRHMANRDIRHTLTALADIGVTARYYPVNVTHAGRISGVLKKIRADLGPVTALIHGAGVLRDSLIVDKKLTEFDPVWTTKVDGLRHLLDATRSDELKNIVLFSSVSARFGNPGQADYAMANEAINKLARAEAIRRPRCNVSAINWGPWESGMVSPALKRLFARRGVELIPVQAGMDALVKEMGAGPGSPVEVVIGSQIPVSVAQPLSASTSAADAAETDPPSAAMTLSFRRDVDVHRYPVLNAHVIDGHPVVPFALMTEWFAHGALHENPGLFLAGIDDMRILKGIRLNGGAKTIRLMAGKARRHDNRFEVPVALHDGVQQGTDVVHCRGRAILATAPVKPPAYDIPPELTASPYPRSVAEVYEEILFHGKELHGLRKIRSLTAAGMVADIRTAPRPDQWMTEPLRSSWLADPLALDTAFQMASLWCYEQKGMVSLPSYTAAYRQYAEQFPASGLTAVLEVRAVTSRKITGDYTFIGPDGRVVAQFFGYEAMMDPALNAAFKASGNDNCALENDSSAA